MPATPKGPLSGQIAVITGGGHGIGGALAAKLAALGAVTVICGRTLDPLERTAAALRKTGAACEPVVCDVTDLASVDSLVARVSDHFRRVDILINNAGIGAFSKPLHELTPQQWGAVMNTNLRGVYYMIRAFAPMMMEARSGHIINISSIAGKNALPNGAVYAASKWGLNGLSYSVAEELRAYGVRVSVVCPGSTISDLSPHSGKDPGKMLRSRDIAHVVAMLVTQEPQSFVSEVLIRPTMKP